MIRFCDREVGGAGYKSISWEAAAIGDSLTLDESIWEDAKKKFLCYKSHSNKHLLLPVVDQEGNLVSFAYEDDDANRELRQIRELMENPEAVQFSDMYPDCDCVVIYGFNELAYFFACYLRGQGISVRVEGAMWDSFLASDVVEVPEYRSMKVYAEGTWKKPAKWEENLLRTVSVEFECIDKIYEENIRKGFIRNAAGNCEDMLQRLRSAEAVAILGIDTDAQDSYDFLLQTGIEAESFIVWEDNVFGRKLFGRPVYSMAEAVAKYGNRIAITDNHYENSAWGMGETDYLEYLGYRRNGSYILLRDYVKIQGNSLRTVLKGQKVAMIGDVFLCERLSEYFSGNGIICSDDIKYIMLPDQEAPGGNLLNVADFTEIDPDILCLIVSSECFNEALDLKYKQIKEDAIGLLQKHKLVNYSDYFSFMRTFIDIEKETENRYSNLYGGGVKRIVLGSIEGCCGCAFFRQLLDGHPSIMLAYDHTVYLFCRLFWYCIRLAGKGKEEIIPLLGRWCQAEFKTGNFDEQRRTIFIERVCGLLKSGKTYTSQELFVIFHAALLEKKEEEIKNMIIYWEPHWIPRELVERCVLWLGTPEVPCDIINIVRNSYMAKGSRVKGVLKLNWEPVDTSLYKVIKSEGIKKEEFEGSKRLVVRFEDLKCNPEKELRKICREWGIPWSDSLMETTMCGKAVSYDNGNSQIQGFDLGPVYNQYEEYFSEFDRFRISLIDALWQKAHGYPYVDILLFSRKDLQEMFLKDFRFSKEIKFDSPESKLAFHINLQIAIRQSLQKSRMISLLDRE